MNDDLKSRFAAALAAVKTLPERPDNDMLLRLYALYKQATEGDAGGPRPGMFDFVAAAKYEAWENLKGLGRDEAMQRYIKLVERLAGE